MVAARWNCFSFQLVFTISFVFSTAEVCNGGITSSFVRNSDLSRDMPLDSDVFRVPPGYNAPQQVCFLFFLFFLSISCLLHG